MPNRIIKESTCTSETIDKMSWFEECFYHRLWVNCDDYGRMDARPAILKAKLFPLKERLSLKDIENALRNLADIGCVRMYVCDNKPYLYLPSWEVHQNIRAKRSKYPVPNSENTSDNICMQMRADENICPRNPIQSLSESLSESKKELAQSADIFKDYDFSDKMKNEINYWLTYKNERKESYKPTGLKMFLSEVSNQLNKHYEEDVIQLISECMANGWKGIIWSKLKSKPIKQKTSNPFLDMLEDGDGQN